ncbi:unnamed protein product [Bemisia tabaci]|uniref:Uncharacterized protein n=1 Tax=Bemisia tabaci TaxID=7038 RepID=A0A9P0F9D6_BEMTA|nr:unnamed protein product [Bemisia tabaci]
MIVRTIDDPASPTVSKQQKLRILVRSDAKKSTKKNKYSELVRAPTSERVDGESSTRDTSEEPEVGGSTEATAVGRLNKLTFFRNGEEIKGEDLAKKRVTRLQNPRDSNSEKAVESLEPASANGGNDKTNSSADDGDEDKKTLSQQVADGKYGLIHTELFSVKPTRPGIINYEINPEVPKDNVNNLGGLNAEEIWLAENHLLVLSGGGFSDQNSRTRWTPIDNYQAPRRQVKIPERPKVPPPFPVQLTDDGPIEFLKDENGTEHRPPFFPPDFNPLAFPPPFPPNGSFDGGFPPPFPVPPGFFPGNITPGAYPPFPPPYPFPPSLQNDSRPLPLPPRLPPKLPFLPPPGNGTEFDEDDPALYYPPPYDFYYPKDNHSIVPPGPLVPGIVLPPPPDFFAPLNEKPKNKTKTKSKARPRPSNTYLPPPPLKKVPQIFRTTTSTTTSTIATTTAKPIVHNDVTTPEYYYVQTTSPKPIADDITNEITQTTVSNPKYSLPIEENDWMPIPAPVPSYITGPKKPVKAGIVYTFTHTTPPASKPIFHGYTYEKPKIPFKTPDLDLYYKPQQNTKYDDQQSFTPSNFSNQINNELNLVYPVDNDPPRDPSYVTSTGSPSPLYDSLQFKHNFKDYFGGTHLKGSKGFLQSTTDTPFKSYSTTLRPYGKPKALEATYYFYEEPKESSDEYTDGKHTHTKATRKPHHAFYPTPGNGFHSSTPRPIYHHAQSDYNSVTSTTTPAPEKYYYVADLSDPEKFNSEEKYKPSIFDETLKKPLKSEVGSRPIVEFSYSAPSYSGDSGAGHLSDYFNSKPFFDSPKFVVTPKPDNVVYVRPARPTQSPLDDYYSTTKPPRVFKSANRTVTTQQTPWYGLTKEQIATENPYYAFFTHQDDGLIDDITKTYFTIFGQKIKATPSPDIDAPRKHPRPHQPKSGAPAPPLLFNGAIYSSPKPNYIELPYQPVSHRPEHTTSNYATSSEDYGENFPNRYTTTRPPQIAFPTFSSPHENVQFTTPKPFYHGSYGSGNKLVPIQYSTPQPSGDSSNHHFNQRPIKIRPPVLYNDELVNYKRPLPPINPDAEFIAPRPFRNNKFKGRPRLPSGTSQIISYRLPGNGGGHFYFLTPQEVRNFDPIEPLAGENGETEDKGYFKRETHRTLDVERGGKETKVQPVEVK